MKAKKSTKKGSKKLSSTRLMFLSFILLFIIFEALFILKNQQEELQSNSRQQSVAGVNIEK